MRHFTGINRYKQLKDRIEALKAGSVVTVSDFADLADAKTVSKYLTRLCESGRLSRLMQGVFWMPDAGSVYPPPDAVAEAIARGNSWYHAPSGETALHLFGLSDQAPPVWTYVSSGTGRSYHYAGGRITFTHTTEGHRLHRLSKKTRLLVQCLKAYGKDHMSEELLLKMKRLYGVHDTKRLGRETGHMPAWVARTVTHMFGLVPVTPR